MSYKVITTSTYAGEILAENRAGIVHSVYRNTVNVSIDGHLLAIQTADSPLSPISLITDMHSEELEKLGFTAGDSISIENISHAEIFNLAPAAEISKEIRDKLYKKISRAIMESETGGFELIFQTSPKADQDFIVSAAKMKINEAHKLYRQNFFRETADKLCRLIGLGIGLTPSGDDFLCGILAGLHMQGKESTEFADFLRGDIQKNLYRTNEISAAFLSCALEGHFSLAVNQLWTNPCTEQILQMFQSIGHSSGMDTLCGIYFSFLLLND